MKRKQRRVITSAWSAADSTGSSLTCKRKKNAQAHCFILTNIFNMREYILTNNKNANTTHTRCTLTQNYYQIPRFQYVFFLNLIWFFFFFLGGGGGFNLRGSYEMKWTTQFKFAPWQTRRERFGKQHQMCGCWPNSVQHDAFATTQSTWAVLTLRLRENSRLIIRL